MLNPFGPHRSEVDFAVLVLQAKSQRFVHRSAGLYTIVNEAEIDPPLFR
jgi:hypothetical protein